MTREERTKLKELKAALPKMIKDKIKKYKFKKISDIIWYSSGELFFDLIILVNEPTDGHACCIVREEIKPLWLDDLFWELFEMESNKSAPLSLRANGAFTVRGPYIFENQYEINDLSVEELDICVDTCLKHFYQTTRTAGIQDFYQLSKAPLTYHKELRDALILVHDEKFEEALDYLSDFDNGYFKNGDLDIFDAIRDFCKKKLL